MSEFWATVTGDDPLTVRRDHETVDVPARHIGYLPSMGARVRCSMDNLGKVVVLACGQYDSGWTDLTLASGFTAEQPVRIRRIGSVVYMRGSVSPSSDYVANTDATIIASGGIPSEFRPASSFNATQVAAASNAAYTFRVSPQVDGSLPVRASGNTGSWLYLGGVTWPVG